MSNKRLEKDLFGDTAGLTPAGPRRPLPGKGWYLGLAGLFLALTVLPGLVDTLHPLRAASAVGEAARTETERQQNLSWADGSRGRWWEEQRKERSRVRQWVLPPYSAALIAGFGTTQDKLYVGKDDWLFYKDNAKTPLASDEQVMQRAMDLLTTIHNLATDAGHRLIIVPIPRKSSMAAAYLPDGVESRPELEDLLAERLAGSDLEVIDLLPSLRSLPKRWDESAYYAGDSHLTCVAMVEMAEAVAHQIGMWQPDSDRFGRLQDLGPRPPRTDLLHLAGIDTSSWSGSHLAPEPQRCFSVFDPQAGEAVQRLVEPQGVPRVGWFGTSYSALSQVSVYLSHFIGEPVADYAVIGVHAIRELEERLERRHQDPLPEILILEIPNAQLFDWNRHEGLPGVDLTPPAAPSPGLPPPPGPAPSPDASRP